MTRTYLLALVLLISGCSSTSSPSAQVDPAHEAFSSLLAQGQLQMETGHPEEALASFRKADQLDRFEVPNYEALVHVAEALCDLGDTAEGLAALTDFRCAIEVDAGNLPCYIGPETLAAPGELNPELTAGCAPRMCGELFLAYYTDGDEAKARKLTALRQKAADVEASCQELAGRAGPH